MKKNYLLITFCALLINAMTYSQEAKYFLDFEETDALTNLPSGVTNVNGANTVRVKNTTDFPAIPNAVQSDPDANGENELFLDFHGYLKLDLTNPASFSLAYDYRRTDDNDDWWLGFLSFIGNDGTENRLEQLQIREWDGQLNYADENTGSAKPISFNTNYHVVFTSNNGDIKVYVNDVEVLNVPFSSSGKDVHTWTNTALLFSFKGDSFDGTSVTPEPEYSSSARDARVYVDNIALFDRELSSAEVTQLFNNGNNNLGVLSVSDNSFLDNKIKIYPNPVNNSVDELQISSNKVESVEIYNILGAKVLSEKLTNSTLSVRKLAKGTYVLKLFNIDGKNISNNRIIKF